MDRYVITLRPFATRAAGPRRALAARLDALGVGLSGLCAVHCLALPLLLGSGVALSAGHGAPTDPTHVILFALAGPVSLAALWRGYRRQRSWPPLAVGALGVALLGRGLFLADDEALARALTLAGAGILALTHLYNWRRHRSAHSATPQTAP